MGDDMKMIGFMFCLMFLWLPVQIQANSVYFTWHNTTVNIPLGENLEAYLDVPYATLNSPNADPQLYYEKNGVNFTYQSIIQTQYAKTYRLDFRVVSPKYKVQSVQTITFIVIDEVPPVFTKIPIFEVPVFIKQVDFSSGLRYEDNYSIPSKITLSIDQNAVNLNQIGTYTLRYTIRDEFGNVAYATTVVHVKDYYAPQIVQTKPLTLEPHEQWVITDYFLIKDNYDTVPLIHVNDQAVDYTTEGQYPITISAIDLSGNGTVLQSTIFIQDQTPPELYLRSTHLTVLVGKTLNLSENILKVTDNYTKVFIEDVQITSDIDTSRVGFYEVLYELIDGSGLKTVQKVIIYVVDKTPPSLTFSPLSIQIHTPYNLYEGLTYDSNYKITVFDTNIQMKSGVYQVVYLVIDPYGNHNVFTRTVTVVDPSATNINPLIWLLIPLGLLSGGYFLYGYWQKRHT